MAQNGTIWDAMNGEFVGILEGFRGAAIGFEITLDGQYLIRQRAGGVIEVWGGKPITVIVTLSPFVLNL